jgi:hypothetical protein
MRGRGAGGTFMLGRPARPYFYSPYVTDSIRTRERTFAVSGRLIDTAEPLGNDCTARRECGRNGEDE